MVEYQYNIIITMVTGAKYRIFKDIKGFDENSKRNEHLLYGNALVKNFLSENMVGGSNRFISATPEDNSNKTVYLKIGSISEVNVDVKKYK